VMAVCRNGAFIVSQHDCDRNQMSLVHLRADNYSWLSHLERSRVEARPRHAPRLLHIRRRSSRLKCSRLNVRAGACLHNPIVGTPLLAHVATTLFETAGSLKVYFPKRQPQHRTWKSAAFADTDPISKLHKTTVQRRIKCVVRLSML
jgi:hypothetical protein